LDRYISQWERKGSLPPTIDTGEEEVTKKKKKITEVSQGTLVRFLIKCLCVRGQTILVTTGLFLGKQLVHGVINLHEWIIHSGITKSQCLKPAFAEEHCFLTWALELTKDRKWLTCDVRLP
jgi:hypothetical protein